MPDTVRPKLNAIPEALQTSIISYLDPKTFVMLTRVSDTFKKLIDKSLPENIHRFYGLYTRLTCEYYPYEHTPMSNELLDGTLYLRVNARGGLTYFLKNKNKEINQPVEGEIVLPDNHGFSPPERRNNTRWVGLFFDDKVMSGLAQKQISLDKSDISGYNVRVLNHALYFLAQLSVTDRGFNKIFWKLTEPDAVFPPCWGNLKKRPIALSPKLLYCVQHLPQICNTPFKAHLLMQQQDLYQLLLPKELVNLSLLRRLKRVWRYSDELKQKLLHRIGSDLHGPIHYSFLALLGAGFLNLIAVDAPLICSLIPFFIFDLFTTREPIFSVAALLMLISYGTYRLLISLPGAAVLIAAGAVIAFLSLMSLMSVLQFIKDTDDHILFSTVKSRADKYDPSVQKQKAEPAPELLLPSIATPTSELTYSQLFFRSLLAAQHLPKEQKDNPVLSPNNS